jgi:hypothetical protein
LLIQVVRPDSVTEQPKRRDRQASEEVEHGHAGKEF